jgi:nucleolar complex protein 3
MQRALMNTSYLQGRIKEIHSLHNTSMEDYGALVKALHQECDIFCEIIPNYKISATMEGSGEEGQGVRMKKEVFNVEKLEHEMLTQYEHFLQLLRRLQRKNHPEQQALGSRLCAKLVGASSAPEFNHADKLLTLAVEFSNAKAVRVAQPALKALSELLDGKMISDATEHVVAAILNIVRKQQYAMNPKVLNTLLYIRVAMIDMHRRDFAEEKAKNKKMKKEDKEIARQMMKSKARKDRSELAAKQTRLIHKIFVIYLRVIQASKECSKIHQTKILAPALEGLVKFAPLVNVELYHQLMAALKELLAEEGTSVTTRLHSLVAVASLAQKDAAADSSEWRVDLSHFHEILFRCIPEALEAPRNEDIKKGTGASEEGAEEASAADDDVVSVGSTATAGSLSSVAFSIAASMAQGKFVQSNSAKEWTYRVGLVLRTVDLLILSQKHLPVIRVTSFVRRLLQSIPYVPPHIGMSIMALAHRLAMRYPQAASIIIGGSDNAIGGRGVYNPAAEQTSAMNAEASFAWELTLLARAYHPTQRSIYDAFAKHFHRLAKCKPGEPAVQSKQLNALGPYEVLEEYNTALGDIKPPPPLPSALKRRSKPAKRSRDEDEMEDSH